MRDWLEACFLQAFAGAHPVWSSSTQGEECCIAHELHREDSGWRVGAGATGAPGASGADLRGSASADAARKWSSSWVFCAR